MVMNDDTQRPPDLPISPEDWEQTPPGVRAVLLLLYQQVQILEREVADLKEQIKLHSGNSSQPPSSDKPGKKEKCRKSGSGKKRGAQPGHQGTTRKLLPLDQVDQIIIHKPEACAGCGALLLGADPHPQRHQVTEIRRIETTVTEHQVHEIACLKCGTQNRGQLPEEVASSQFGETLVGMIGMLMGVYRLSKRQVVQILRDLGGPAISVGSVVNQQQVVSASLAEAVAEAYDVVHQQPTRYIDETGWKQHHQERSSYLWTVVTQAVTVFRIAASRSGRVARDLLGTSEQNYSVSDRYSAYNGLPKDRHQTCWAHLLRHWKRMVGRGGDSRRVGMNLVIYTEYLLYLWGRVRDGTMSREEFLAEVPELREKTHYWLDVGACCSHPKTAKTCRQLLKQQSILWTFTQHEGVEPTNNAAERALRHAVIWRKLSHGTQSEAGSRFVERILTVVETRRQHGQNPLDFIRDAVVAYRRGLPAPSLIST